MSNDPTDLTQEQINRMSPNERVDAAICVGFHFGCVDGAHHKMWTIDQMLRILTGADYPTHVADFEEGEDGPKTYEWSTGIAP